MKTKFTLSLTLSFLLFSHIAVGQAERTFVKSFNLLGKQKIVLNLGENVRIVPWDSELMRIQMTVSLSTTNDATLKALAETGRYTLKSEIKEQSFDISTPFLQNSLKLNGHELAESIFYVIYAPKDAVIMNNGTLISNVLAKTKN